jgi:hypothetical protein
MKNSAIENQFKVKMNAREIVPSKASWDRLDAMLTVAEKPKRNFKWMYIAASFLGFLMISTLYFDKNKKGAIINNDNIVVNEPKNTSEISVKSAKVNLVEVETTKGVEKKLASKEMKSGIDSNSLVSNAAIQVVEKEVIQEPQIPIINQKAEQKIVLQKSKYVNVDELLASVDNASQENGLRVVKSNVKVSSNELLTQVDGELDLSFREKAIKTVNQKFRTAKLALSNRNSK